MDNLEISDAPLYSQVTDGKSGMKRNSVMEAGTNAEDERSNADSGSNPVLTTTYPTPFPIELGAQVLRRV